MKGQIMAKVVSGIKNFATLAVFGLVSASVPSTAAIFVIIVL